MNRRLLYATLIALITLVGLSLNAQAQDGQDAQEPPAQEAPAPDQEAPPGDAAGDDATEEGADGQGAAGENAEGQDADGEGAAGDDAAGQDGAAQDGAAQDGAAQDGAAQDGAAQDAAGDDAAQQDAAGSDAAEAGQTLWISALGGFGEHLVTGEGLAVYAYTEDGEGASACTGRCAELWPPVTVEGERTIGEGLDESLVGTVEREDGTTQLTYAGMPLYTNARDTAEADTKGQALGNQFFLVAPAGETITQVVEDFEAAEVDDETMTALLEEGEQAYAANCAVCHGDEGQGGVGPSLQNNARLADTTFFVGRILNGFPDHGMPAFRDQLNDRQIAAIATFSRENWGNEWGAVIEEQVEELR